MKIIMMLVNVNIKFVQILTAGEEPEPILQHLNCFFLSGTKERSQLKQR